MAWALIIHGGAGRIPATRRAAVRTGCLTALAIGCNLLQSGGSALEAVEAVVRALEDDPAFNAGVGAVANSRGLIELDAAVMDGRTLDVGAVAAVRGVRHPVSVARRLLRERPVLLAGEGAYAFAAARGGELCPPEAPIIADRGGATAPVAGGDTVGALACDATGNLAAAGSTGGLAGKPPGRVGDTPLPGAGLYADNGRGAVALSGEGEAIIRLALAARIVDGLAPGLQQEAVDTAIARLAALGEGGAIALTPQGLFGWAHNSPDFAVGFARDGSGPHVFLGRREAEEME